MSRSLCKTDFYSGRHAAESQPPRLIATLGSIHPAETRAPNSRRFFRSPQPAKDPLGLTDAIHSSPQVFPERLQVVLVPTAGEMLTQAVGKSGVIEEDRG